MKPAACLGIPISIHHVFPNPDHQQRLRAGPLAGDIDGFAAWLAGEGYSHSSARDKLLLTADLSLWLAEQGLELETVNEQRVEAFMHSRKARRGDPATGRQLLAYLRDRNRVPPALCAPPGDGGLERIACTYERFLIEQRAVSPATVRNYLPVVRAFLDEHCGSREIDLASLSARHVNQFVRREAERLSRSRAKLVVTALRSFLRHLHQQGELPADLASAVLPVMRWRLSGLPRSLAPEQVMALLASCDRETLSGRRDYAILLLLARLGLRAGEVSALTLDDFDWHEGIVTVPGKGQRREPLPLPHEVGEALAAYLQDGRPSCATRRLFMRSRAPHQGFRSAVAICCIVRRALARAGIDSSFKGAHLLRHFLATGMLCNGASLEDIGQVLRHRHPETTQIYAKVALEALRALAPVWPGGVA